MRKSIANVDRSIRRKFRREKAVDNDYAGGIRPSRRRVSEACWWLCNSTPHARTTARRVSNALYNSVDFLGLNLHRHCRARGMFTQDLGFSVRLAMGFGLAELENADYDGHQG